MPYKNKEDRNANERKKYRRNKENNPEKEKERKRKFKEKNPEYFSNYYQEMKAGTIKTWENTPVEDITGSKYGMLTAVEFSHREEPLGRAVWKFKCDCGKTKTIKSCDVVTGKTKSCGCLSKGRDVRHKLEESSFYALYNAYRGGAKHRNLPFELSAEEFKVLTKGNCKYCGIGPVHLWRSQVKSRTPYLCNGVDRVDNKQGYTITNSVTCCKTCNHAKHTMSLQEFNEWLDRIVKFRTNTNSESPAVVQGNESNP